MRSFWDNLKFAWIYAKDEKAKLIKYILFNVISVIISIIIPVFGAKMIIHLTSNELYRLIVVAALVFIMENLRNVVNYKTRYYSQVIYRETFTKIQLDLGSNILKLENKVIDENGSGVFIQRLTNDTSRLADIFNLLNMNLSHIITIVGVFIAIFFLNKITFVYLVFMNVLLFIIEHNRVKKYTEMDKSFRKKNERVSGFVGEIVRGARDIKMLNAEKSFMKELDSKIVDLNSTRYKMQEVNRKFRLLDGFTIDLTDFLLVLLLIYLIINGNLEIANALIIYNYSGRLCSIVDFVGNLLDGVKDFSLSANRIFDIINSEEFKKEEFGNKHLSKIEGNFEFKNVSFAYKDEKVLKDLSFNIKANSTVAFVGKSGAGKSTIFSLLCKMYDCDEGVITIDGIDIRELDKESIRGNITIISQNPYIFNLSIKENLKLVKRDLTMREMKEACKVACLDDFIESLPEKYDTIIGEGGVNLSGGQKQRLAIARALIQKTEIILFDEATSALDNETQASIQKAIENMKSEYTILIIAHRLSTIINSDRILFLDEGKIEMEGTHSELLRKSKKYKQLYESEINKG